MGNPTLPRCLLAASCACVSCSSNPGEIDLMPAPDIYAEGAIDPFLDEDPLQMISYGGVLYATDRAPRADEDEPNAYRNVRGHVLRLGVGIVDLRDERISWEEARRISLLKDRGEDYPLKVVAAREIGVLESSGSVIDAPERQASGDRPGGAAFAELIEEQLDATECRDIYIYVHGYRVVFENPLLVATELWHFLGYRGVFIAYSWPSTPSLWAYASDLETAAYSARNLRLLLEYLARETTAERIHVIGYSAGTRVVLDALWQLALQRTGRSKAANIEELRLGDVVLVGSDADPDLAGSYVDDGMLEIPERLTVYESGGDSALGFSQWLFERARLGQADAGDLDPVVARFLLERDDIAIIDVTEAEGATDGNGHHYFRQSPWVSSDVLSTLYYGFTPGERGLTRTEERPIWTFPPDYVARLRTAVEEREERISEEAPASTVAP